MQFFLKGLTAFIFMVGVAPGLNADPPVLPPPACPVPCPLICFQLTDMKDMGNDTWRFEFEVLNWTLYQDPSCQSICVSSLGCVNSVGANVAGLTMVRSAGLSTVTMRPIPSDPNGAPMSVSDRTVNGTLSDFGGGDFGMTLAPQFRFIEDLTSFSLIDPVDDSLIPVDLQCVRTGGDIDIPELILSTTGSCVDLFDPLLTPMPEIEAVFSVHDTDWNPANVKRNNWGVSQCSVNQIVWNSGSGAGDTTIPPENSIQAPCPSTCAEKDGLSNVLDGFIFEVPNFTVGERLIFNWYLLDEEGIIADGLPPTANDTGTLGVSAKDPVGFSFGSFQIDRVASCASGCDTQIIMGTPVTNPAISCLVDLSLNRNDYPFDFYVSMLNAGPPNDCGVSPITRQDERGIERAALQATLGSNSNRMVVTFTSLEGSEAFDAELLQSSLPGGVNSFVLDPEAIMAIDGTTRTLRGRYEISGTCHETGGNFSQFAGVEVAITAPPDHPTIAGGEDTAFEYDAVTNRFDVTGLFPGLPSLSDNLRYWHIWQVQDMDNDQTHILATEERTDWVRIDDLADPADRFYMLPDAVAPTTTHECRYPDCDTNTIRVDTNLDGGLDCSVDVAVTVSATEDAGNLSFSYAYNNGSGMVSGQTHSFSSQGGGTDEARLNVFDSFEAGTSTPITFTAVDSAGNSTDHTVTVVVTDKTPPRPTCEMIPLEPPLSNNNGRGGGNGGNNGNSPDGCSNHFQISIGVNDNCDPNPTLILAEIDGINLFDHLGPINGATVTILKKKDLTHAMIMTKTPNEDLRIQTPDGGVLTVTYRDAAGNEATCQNTQTLPTIGQQADVGQQNGKTASGTSGGGQ